MLELEPFIKSAGANNVYDSANIDVMQHDYDIVKYLIGYPIAPKGNYPDEPMTKNLIEYFAEELELIV